jgi:predicted nucleotidyltransferase
MRAGHIRAGAGRVLPLPRPSHFFLDRRPRSGYTGNVNRELIDLLRTAAAEAFASTPVFLAYAYGSRVYGSPHAGSDLDIAYFADAGAESALQALDRELALEIELSRRTGMNVDLRDLRRAPLELRGRVMVEGVRIYCSDRVKQVNLERETVSRYQDYRETFDRMHTARLKSIAARGL